MSSKYLLPCLCGLQIAIEPRQAGETVVCQCGAKIQVPSMLEIRALEPAPVESTSPRPAEAWGWRQLLKMLGVILLLVAIISWVLLERPVSRFKVMPPEILQRSAQELTPSQTWDQWQWAKRGLDRRIDQQYVDAMLRFRIWQSVFVFLPALAGVGLIAVGMVPHSRKQWPGANSPRRENLRFRAHSGGC